MAEAFLGLSTQDRRDALGVAVDRSGRPAHLLEKDVWVVWAIAAGATHEILCRFGTGFVGYPARSLSM